MEEFLILVFQVLIEMFINLPWDVFGPPSSRRHEGDSNTLGGSFLSLFVGAALGGVSLWLYPDVIARHGWLRIFLLFFAPAFAGTTGYALARWRRGNFEIISCRYFWWNFMFTAGYVLIRFTYAVRA